MAFLVCYSNQLADHTRDRAIYLDQGFYGMIFGNCRLESSGFRVLRQIALLRYKSPTILLSPDQLARLISELEALESTGPKHPQTPKLKAVCRDAIGNDTNLTISGDMHPELDG